MLSIFHYALVLNGSNRTRYFFVVDNLEKTTRKRVFCSQSISNKRDIFITYFMIPRANGECSVVELVDHECLVSASRVGEADQVRKVRVDC